MPSFYLHLGDAKIQQESIANLRMLLDLVKGVHSSDILAFHGTLLDVAVSRNVHWKVQVVSCILKS
jgi:hypothetical protein